MSTFPTKILFATDGSEDAQLAATTAVDLANGIGSELHVVHARFALPFTTGYYSATEPPTTSIASQEEAKQIVLQWLDEQVERIEAQGGSARQTYLRLGRPDEGAITVAEQIVNLAEEIRAGLIVIGSRGRSGIRRALMGSVSDSVVRHAHCPVLVVRKEKR